MHCPNCGSEINTNQEICANCGTELGSQSQEHKENASTTVNNYFIYGLSFICITFIILYFSQVITRHNTITSSSDNKDFYKQEIIGKSCDSEEIVDFILNEYKSKDYYYNQINPSSVESVTLQVPKTTLTDKILGKNTCSGSVIVKANHALLPKNYNFDNGFYNIIQTDFISEEGIPLLRNAIKINCKVTYSKKISKKQPTTSYYCGEIKNKNNLTEPTITWADYQKHIEQPGERERIEKEIKKDKAQRRLAEQQKKQEEAKLAQQETSNTQKQESNKGDEPDFGPYMKELQQHIKSNWNPPRGNFSRRVVVFFTITNDGILKSCSVLKSSGLPEVDQAAIDAVNISAPFKPLPKEYKRPSIDIQFTFDYNVFNNDGTKIKPRQEPQQKN